MAETNGKKKTGAKATKLLAAHVDVALYERAEAECKAKHPGLSSLMRTALLEYLERHAKPTA